MPDVAEVLFNLFLAVQCEFVLHHHARERETGAVAVFQHFGRGFERIRYANLIRCILAKMFFINDEPTANGIVRFAVNDGFAVVRMDLHSVFMQRQIAVVKTHAVILWEIHFVLALRKQQASTRLYIADKSGNAVNVHGSRLIARQTHNNGDIGVVTFTRERQ